MEKEIYKEFDIKRKSVSYTHLRAHETVLDLVCRLLLEKKNNHKSYPVVVLIHTTKRS